MKILLVSIKTGMLPIGLAYISSALKQAGHAVDCFTYEHDTGLIEKLQNKYDIVATGGLSVHYKELKSISDVVHDNNIRFIVGGGIITSEPELMSRALKADFAIIGEGEITIVDLLTCIGEKSTLSAVDGIGYFENDTFIRNKDREPCGSLDKRPFPDYDGFGYQDYLDTAKSSDQYFYDIFDAPREYPIISSRSCPFKCTFCYHPLGDTYRQRSIASVIDELKTVVPKYHINIISIYDELFSYHKNRVAEFCHHLKEYLSTIPWEVKWNCQLRVSGLKPDMLDMMKEAGCYMVSYGFESFSPLVLKSMRKGITPHQIKNAIETTLDRGISIQANFIFGDKAETIQTALETLNFWKAHLNAGILLSFIIACPNSNMYQHCIEKGIIKDRLDFIANHMYETLNMTSMSDSEFMKLRSLVARYTEKYIICATPIKRTPTSITITCPHCKQTIKYDNYVVSGSRMNKMTYCRNCRKRFFVNSRRSRITKRFNGVINYPFIFKLRLDTKKTRRKIKHKLRELFNRNM